MITFSEKRHLHCADRLFCMTEQIEDRGYIHVQDDELWLCVVTDSPSDLTSVFNAGAEHVPSDFYGNILVSVSLMRSENTNATFIRCIFSEYVEPHMYTKAMIEAVKILNHLPRYEAIDLQRGDPISADVATISHFTL